MEEMHSKNGAKIWLAGRLCHSAEGASYSGTICRCSWHPGEYRAELGATAQKTIGRGSNSVAINRAEAGIVGGSADRHEKVNDINGEHVTKDNVLAPSDAPVDWRRAENGGNWYYSADLDMEGWLCPALFRYFSDAPASLYAQVKARV